MDVNIKIKDYIGRLNNFNQTIQDAAGVVIKMEAKSVKHYRDRESKFPPCRFATSG